MFNSTVSKQIVAAALNCSIRTSLVLMFVAFAGFGFGHSVDSPEYHDAKANGTLPSEDLSLPFSGSQEQFDFMATPLSSSASSFTSSNPVCFIPIEDDWSELAANDDGSTSLISLPFTFSMYGQDYTAVYVNNNGNITFDSPFSTFIASGFPTSTPMVAPFWGDVDTPDLLNLLGAFGSACP